MASAIAIGRAEAYFRKLLDVEPAVATKVVDAIRTTYASSIATASATMLMDAATWAAGRLRDRFDDEEALRQAENTEIVLALSASGCPLCASPEDELLEGKGTLEREREPA